MHVRDLKTRAKPWTVRDLDVVLRRDRDRVVARGSARLPESLGKRIGFEAELEGTLAEPRDLAGRVDLEVERLVLPGLAELLPSGIARPLAGTGRVNARVAFGARRLQELRLDLELRELALSTPARNLPELEVLELTPPRRAPGSSPLSMPEVEKRWRRQPVKLPPAARYELLAGHFALRGLDDGWAFDAARPARRAGDADAVSSARPAAG